jgi:hypothetical protein
MLDTPAHAVGAERSRAEIQGSPEVGAGIPVTEVAERYGVSVLTKISAVLTLTSWCSRCHLNASLLNGAEGS